MPEKFTAMLDALGAVVALSSVQEVSEVRRDGEEAKRGATESGSGISLGADSSVRSWSWSW